MGLHQCHHPCWHRALMLFGTLGYFYGVGLTAVSVAPRHPSGEWFFWGTAAFLISTWLFKHLLQWRCQGREPSDGRLQTATALFLASAYLLGKSEDE